MMTNVRRITRQIRESLEATRLRIVRDVTGEEALAYLVTPDISLMGNFSEVAGDAIQKICRP